MRLTNLLQHFHPHVAVEQYVHAGVADLWEHNKRLNDAHFAHRGKNLLVFFCRFP